MSQTHHPDRFCLAGKHALITGGTRGIGLAIARGYVQAGAQVTLCGRKAEGVAAARELLAPWADRVFALQAHVGLADDRLRLVAEAEARFGTIHVLVNNAGTNPYFGPLENAEEWAWEKTMAVNLKAPFHLGQLVARKMFDHGSGSILNIASIAGLEASPGQGIYSVTKAALIMLTKVMAREWGPRGVRANCLCPGLIQTELSQLFWSDPQRLQPVIARKALGRVGHAEEIVGAALYLASDASSFTTGAVLSIDGGMVI